MNLFFVVSSVRILYPFRLSFNVQIYVVVRLLSSFFFSCVYVTYVKEWKREPNKMTFFMFVLVTRILKFLFCMMGCITNLTLKRVGRKVKREEFKVLLHFKVSLRDSITINDIHEGIKLTVYNKLLFNWVLIWQIGKI